MPSDLDKKFVRLAIEQAMLSRENGNMPFGAVLVKDEELIATGQNQVITKSDHTYHAELGLIRDYCQLQNISDLSEYTLYASCEPCVMCACAMIWVKLGRLVYSASKDTMDQYAGKYIETTLQELFDGSIYKPELLGGILEEEGKVVFEGYNWN